MSIETDDNIKSRLLLRELGFRTPPLPLDASLTAFDVEDGFLEVEEDSEFKSPPKPNPDTEPE